MTEKREGQPEGIQGEGNYEAGRRFQKEETEFVKTAPIEQKAIATKLMEAVGDAAWIGDEAYELSVTRFLERPGRLGVTIRFLDPIDPAVAGDRKKLAALARAAVIAGLPGVRGIEDAVPAASVEAAASV